MYSLFVLSLTFISPAQQRSAKPAAADQQPSGRSSVSLATYHGWPNSLVISNGVVEAVVVPVVGRIMQFHFIGEPEVFWENRSLDGKAPDSAAQKWGNFGGDKTWPAPQDDWDKMIGRGWPPPPTFDATPVNGISREDVIDLNYPVDPAYGIRVHRRIGLNAFDPTLTITTIYEKLSGNPVRIGIGVITQLTEPQRAFMVPPQRSEFPQGYVKLQFGLPQDLKVEPGLVSLRGGVQSQIGSDAGTLLWMNDKCVLRIDSPRVPGAEYADKGSSTEIYTGSGPRAYIELEAFGPLSTMKAGDRIERTNTYTLSRRTEKDPAAEARKVLGR